MHLLLSCPSNASSTLFPACLPFLCPLCSCPSFGHSPPPLIMFHSKPFWSRTLSPDGTVRYGLLSELHSLRQQKQRGDGDCVSSYRTGNLSMMWHGNVSHDLGPLSTASGDYLYVTHSATTQIKCDTPTISDTVGSSRRVRDNKTHVYSTIKIIIIHKY